MSDRTVLSVSGADRRDFLQGLVTNDVEKIGDGPVYAALLSAQGKFLIDFFMIEDGEEILLDVATDHAASLLKRLTMYRLRADVAIAPTQIAVSRGRGPVPQGAHADPRHPELGWRGYGEGFTSDDTDWDAVRVAQMVPETGAELIPDASYILEMRFETLNGVDFKKGCYVGQEVTARMKHKTELRKGLALVEVDGQTDLGADITRDGKTIGQVFTQAGNQALAYLRFDRADGALSCGDASLKMVSKGS